jgi:phosphoribosyl 1,2-cyclic phosphate phosphodiesterase
MKTVATEEREKLKGVKVLVINALRETEHISHFNLEEALEFIEDVNPERAYLTHISHFLGFHEDVQKKLPKNVFLAHDNLQIAL